MTEEQYPGPPLVRRARLEDPGDCAAVTALVDAYAREAHATGAPLPEDVRRRLGPALREHPTTLAYLGIVDGRAVGVAVCFLGFSTFAARPLMNIHDLAVLADYRRRGLGRLLLQYVEARARELGCCKLTLEVRRDNYGARALYRDVGFNDAQFGKNTVPLRFLEKRLG